MLTASILLDGAATVFNHYYDFKKANLKKGYQYDVHNPIVAYKLKPSAAFFTASILVAVSGLLGLYIMLSTSWILLPIGCASALISYFYSAGKHPISYSPWGEITSGLFEGTIVFCIAYFIQCTSFSYTVLLVSIPVSIGISNIMLANNTCDVDEDRSNGRKTLPIVIGQENGVRLLYGTHFLMFFLSALYLIFGLLPVTVFLIYLLIPFAVINLNKFNRNRTKARGFVHILQNTILFNLLLIISLFASFLLIK
jgi:1,4-dihydroxy-2-naphthoate octaprenyltransferase